MNARILIAFLLLAPMTPISSEAKAPVRFEDWIVYTAQDRLHALARGRDGWISFSCVAGHVVLEAGIRGVIFSSDRDLPATLGTRGVTASPFWLRSEASGLVSGAVPKMLMRSLSASTSIVLDVSDGPEGADLEVSTAGLARALDLALADCRPDDR